MKGRVLFILEKKPQLLVYIFAALTVSSALTAAHGQSTEQLYKQAIAGDERGDISQAILLYGQLVWCPINKWQ